MNACSKTTALDAQLIPLAGDREPRFPADSLTDDSAVPPVLVLDGEQRAALAVVRSLGERGCTVHVGSSTARSLGGGSRFAASESMLPDPLAGSEPYAVAVRRLLEVSQSAVLIPTTEASMLAVLERRELFAGVATPTSDLTQFLRASDKALVLRLATELGIAVPRQWSIAPGGGPPLGLSRDQFPIVVKPARSVIGEDGRRHKGNVTFADSPEALRGALLAETGPVLLQERIEGPGLGVFVLRWRGEVLASFAHRRIREKPPSGGVSVCCESVELPPALLERSTALLEALDWNGVAMVEYKRDSRSGRDYLMEINPRFWGSLQLAIDAGVDFPWLLLQAALGRAVTPVHQWRVGLRSRWVLGELDHLIARLRRSRAELSLPEDAPGVLRTAASILTPWRPGQRNDVMRLSDPVPSLREAAAWLRNL
jgi:predicted ATP-grasp superfamily ATP-dependent carboligase